MYIMMASPQIDQQVITKLRAICAGETNHVTLMVLVAGELFHTVDKFDWIGFYRVAPPGVLKLGPYQGGHGCLVISFDKGHNLVAVLDIDSDQPAFLSQALAVQLVTLLAKLFGPDEAA